MSDNVRYDAIVVGARCAGSPTAMLLARRGMKVLLVDKVSFPRDTVSSLYIQRQGVECLRRWGLLEAVIASNAPRISQMSWDFGSVSLSGFPEPGAFGIAPRRSVLDSLLFDAAVSAGAEARVDFVVRDLVVSQDRVTGIVGDSGGKRYVEETRLVIGADGYHSAVARLANASTFGEQPALTAQYYGFFEGLPVSGMEFVIREGRAVVMVPTNDGLTLVSLASRIGEFEWFVADLETRYSEALYALPVGERIRAAKRVGPIVRLPDPGGRFHQRHGAGWALVGDAAFYRDPVTAQGMTNAFMDAEATSSIAEDGFAAYAASATAALMPIYEYACKMAQLRAPTAKHLELFARIAQHPMATRHFLGLWEGSIDAKKFYDPENLRTLLR